MKLKPCFGWALSCNGGARYYLGSAEIAGAYNGSNTNASGVDHYRRLPQVGSTYGRCAAGMTPKPGRGVVVRRPTVVIHAGHVSVTTIAGSRYFCRA